MASRVKAPKEISHVAVTIDGQKRKLRYCSRTLRLAAEEGVGFEELRRPFVKDKDGELVLNDKGKPVVRPDVSQAEWLDYSHLVLWLGRIAFEPELTQEDVEMELLIGEMEPAMDAAWEAFRKFMPHVKKGDEDKGESKAAA